MTITVQITGVDGETFFTFITPRPGRASRFLQQEDHEGSQVSVTVRADDEAAHRLLGALEDLERGRG
jgi:hypothetical protein